MGEQKVGPVTVPLKADTGDFAADIGRAAQQFNSQMGAMRKELQQLERQFRPLTDAAKGLGVTLTAALGVYGVQQSVERAITTFGNFERTLNTIKAVSGATATELKLISDSADALGASTIFDIQEVATSYLDLSKAGFTASESLKAMPGILDAAAASGDGLAETATIVAGALRGFGLQADQSGRVSDILAQAANVSAANMSDLGMAIKQVAPIASGSNQSIEDMAAVLSVLSNRMIGGSDAGSDLRNILTRLVSPPKEAAEALGALGIKMTDSEGKIRPFIDVIIEMQGKLEEFDEASRNRLLKDIAGLESLKTLAVLANSSEDELRDLQKQMEQSDGAAKKMAEDINRGVNRSMDEFNGSVEKLWKELGEKLAPGFVSVTDRLTNFLNNAANTQPVYAMAEAVSSLASRMAETDFRLFGKYSDQIFGAPKSNYTLGDVGMEGPLAQMMGGQSLIVGNYPVKSPPPPAPTRNYFGGGGGGSKSKRSGGKSPAQRQHEKDLDDARRIAEETRTAYERYNVELQRLDYLKAKAGLSTEAYTRKIKALKEELEGLVELNDQRQGWMSSVSEGIERRLTASMQTPFDSIESVQASEEVNKNIQERDALIKSLETPLDRLQQQLTKINYLEAEGFFGNDAANIAAELRVQAQKKYNDELQGTNDNMRSLELAVQNFGRGFEDSFIQALTTGKFAFKDFVASALEDLARLIFRLTVINPLVENIAGGLKGKTAGSFLGGLGRSLIGGLIGGGIAPGAGIDPSILPSVVSGARASGGPVSAGKTYLVGERGPELFTPGASGGITPNEALGGQVVQYITINATDAESFRMLLKREGNLIGSMGLQAVQQAENKRGRRGPLDRG